MSRNTLLVDVALAAGIAILVLIVAPGLAVVGLLALLVLLVCVISFGIDVRRGRRREARFRRRPRPAANRHRARR